MRCALSALTILIVATVLDIAAHPRQRPAEGPVAGSAYVDVTVVDGLGAPLGGVTVTLTGMVNREAISNDAGFVAFNALPAGRYDVVAWMKGFAASLPRVFDLAASGGVSVPVTLKPHGPSERSTLACGGFDPRSVRTLGLRADLVLHVRVTHQETVEAARQADEPIGELKTINRVEVLQSFNHRARARVAGSLVIQQGGGRIDRGDYIDYHRFNRLRPLNVGDEYVLFLVSDSEGAYWIHGSEEGAFRIRNGVVEPLGQGGAATAWKRHPTDKFFEALRGLTRR